MVKLRPADRIFAAWIKKRDKHTCQRCGKVYPEKHQGLHCCHWITRRNEATRFDEWQVYAICYGCHSYFHQHPKEHEDWMVKKLGVELFNALLDRRRRIVKRHDKDVIDRYKSLLSIPMEKGGQ